MLITKRQAAEQLGISIRTFDRYRAAGFDFGEVKMQRNIRYIVRFKQAKIKRLAERGFGTR